VAVHGILSLSHGFLNASKVPEIGDYRRGVKPGASNKANADRYITRHCQSFIQWCRGPD
jgi:hypothetical protein